MNVIALKQSFRGCPKGQNPESRDTQQCILDSGVRRNEC